MNAHPVTLAGHTLAALPGGALWWAAQSVLCVSDLHLGKAERFARRGGTLLPPYETEETLNRLDALIDILNPERVICLGDSFDDATAALGLAEPHRLRIARMQAGRDWVWIEGNHDPGPYDLAGRHLDCLQLAGLTFRHIAAEGPDVSGHYHPKARLSGQSRPAFLTDHQRLILPAFGAYTGGLSCDDPIFARLLGADAVAILTGPRAVAVPLARLGQSRGSRRPAATRFGR